MNFFGIGASPEEPTAKYSPVIPNAENELYTLVTSKQPILNLLKSSKDEDKLKGLRVLTAMYFTRKDLSPYLPYAVKIISSDHLVKKLLYFYLTNSCEFGATEILMSISSLHKELTDHSPVVKGTALRALSSLRIEEINSIVSQFISRATADFSIYVRRAAAYALVKINTWEDSDRELVATCVSRLLGDASPLVLGPALVAFTQVCPEKLDLLHSHFRRICRELVHIEPLFISTAIYVLSCYAKAYLDKRPLDPAAKVDRDFKDFLNICEDLLSYDSPSVIVSVAQTMLLFSEINRFASTVQSLLSFNHLPFHLAYLQLTMLSEYSKRSPELFKLYTSYFLLYQYERKELSIVKLRILGNIANNSNISVILKELWTYTRWESEEISILSISTIGDIAESHSELSELCTKQLVLLLKCQSAVVNAQIIIVLRRLITKDPQTHRKIVVHCARIVESIQFPHAKASAIWIIGMYSYMIPTLSAETIRKLSLNYSKENPIVKHQILNTAVRLHLTGPEALKSTLFLCLEYLLNVSFYDLSYDIRDKARLFTAIYITKELKLSDPDVFAVVENPPAQETRDSAYTPLTVSYFLGKKVAGYSKYWEFMDDLELLSTTLSQDTSDLREGETVPVLRIPESTHYSNTDLPNSGGNVTRVEVRPTSDAFLASSDESEGSSEEDSEEEVS